MHIAHTILRSAAHHKSSTLGKARLATAQLTISDRLVLVCYFSWAQLFCPGYPRQPSPRGNLIEHLYEKNVVPEGRVKIKPA